MATNADFQFDYSSLFPLSDEEIDFWLSNLSGSADTLPAEANFAPRPTLQHTSQISPFICPMVDVAGCPIDCPSPGISSKEFTHGKDQDYPQPDIEDCISSLLPSPVTSANQSSDCSVSAVAAPDNMVTTDAEPSFPPGSPLDSNLNRPKLPTSGSISVETDCPRILAPGKGRTYRPPGSNTACKRTNPPRPTTKPGASTQPVSNARASHSHVERRYRHNLNARIFQLDRALSRAQEEGSAGNEEDVLLDVAPDEMVVGATKTRKAEVLLNAINYVRQAEQDKKNLKSEIAFLKLRMAALEKLVKCEDCSLLNQMRELRLQGLVGPLSR